MRSGLFSGVIRHRRFSPVSHQFQYPMFMPLIDLDELGQLERQVFGFGCQWYQFARFKVSDYLRGAEQVNQSAKAGIAEQGVALKSAVLAKLEQLTNEPVSGNVLLLCQLRYAGIYFSPLNLYYVYDEEGQWRWVLAEVSNTPWNERHYYALPASEQWLQRQWLEEKSFHVSPFNPMSQRYYWKLRAPSSRLLLHLDIHDSRTDLKVLDATMSLKRAPMTTSTLWQHIYQTPVQTVKVVWGIYWQALRLWLKKVPFYSHPDSNQSPVAAKETEHFPPPSNNKESKP
ncbi:DUF1365 domain-containing protein (plasmid) [Photobacterium sp. DA100]|uniref:DUF1365 domain-containing protein n=1 Tax=Photobacterium sp. DA100 TaxID=3027472 RepID=UPI00247AFF3B|nr:DUF1365 domain-containing protein [Photobacterium sp. DA100]WEM45664.1 DUF1365 domain-containing protein [Photobacterium sp. DA100]